MFLFYFIHDQFTITESVLTLYFSPKKAKKHAVSYLLQNEIGSKGRDLTS